MTFFFILEVARNIWHVFSQQSECLFSDALSVSRYPSIRSKITWPHNKSIDPVTFTGSHNLSPLIYQTKFPVWLIDYLSFHLFFNRQVILVLIHLK